MNIFEEKVYNELELKNLSKEQLANAMGHSVDDLDSIMKGNKAITVHDCKAIAKLFDTSWMYWIHQAEWFNYSLRLEHSRKMQNEIN